MRGFSGRSGRPRASLLLCWTQSMDPRLLDLAALGKRTPPLPTVANSCLSTISLWAPTIAGMIGRRPYATRLSASSLPHGQGILASPSTSPTRAHGDPREPFAPFTTNLLRHRTSFLGPSMPSANGDAVLSPLLAGTARRWLKSTCCQPP